MTAPRRGAGGSEAPRLPPRMFVMCLGLVLFIGVVSRVAYLLAQPDSDPGFARPTLDAAFYLDWARDLVSGREAASGAFYLAPLYPHVLALEIALFGENPWLLHGLQHAFLLGAAGTLAWAVRAVVGDAAALAAAALLLLHHPLQFFGGRLIGEPISLLLAAGALGLALRRSRGAALGAGLLAGGAALARPNLLLIPVLWAAGEVVQRRWGRAGLIACGTALAVLPVSVRNLAASGHWVLISANSGITSYHGNGPGAGGIYTQPAGFSGMLGRQREEATAIARRISGLDLDDVEADRWWGRQALRTRMADPVGTFRLVAKRLVLLVGNWEHGLDDHPLLDANPWRLTLRGREGQVALVPFALLFGLAGSGLVLRGVRGTGGWPTWTAIACCALTPLLFYVSSRYRLPLVALLTVPAGSGLTALSRSLAGRMAGPRTALLVGVGLAAVSVLTPFENLRRVELAGARAGRGAQLLELGRLDAAETEVRRAIQLDPLSAPAHHNLAVILAANGDEDGAERAYRAALTVDPGRVESANNLARILTGRGEREEAIALLRRALWIRPNSPECWAQLVVLLSESGDDAGARRALEQAKRSGVDLAPPTRQEPVRGKKDG